jgi:hypothetical protein
MEALPRVPEPGEEKADEKPVERARAQGNRVGSKKWLANQH